MGFQWMAWSLMPMKWHVNYNYLCDDTLFCDCSCKNKLCTIMLIKCCFNNCTLCDNTLFVIISTKLAMGNNANKILLKWQLFNDESLFVILAKESGSWPRFWYIPGNQCSTSSSDWSSQGWRWTGSRRICTGLHRAC